MDSSNFDMFSKLQDKFSDIFAKNFEFSQSIVKTRSLIDYNRDLIFIWNPKESNVFVINVAVLAGKKEAKCYQRLELSGAEATFVERLRVNDTGTHAALSGPRGACVLLLPARWGSSGLFAEGRNTVMCKSCSVDASLFLRAPSLELRDFRWCPAPLPDQLFVVLLSNNIIRLYRASEPDTALQEWRVGLPLGRGHLMDPTPMSGGRRVLPLLAGLGQTAVSCDFLPPMDRASLQHRNSRADTSMFRDRTSTPLPPTLSNFKSQSPGSDTEQEDANDIVWPIAVLYGDGDVFIVVPPNYNPTTPSCERAKLYGPLRMLPSTSDNYGAESCALACLQVQPPLLVVASASRGILYHALLLNIPTELDDLLVSTVDASSDVDSTLGTEECGKLLQVIERVELEMGMGLQSEDMSSAYSCPLLLTKDLSNPARYLVSHDAGVHSVTLPIVTELIKVASGQTTMQDALHFMPCEGVGSEGQYLVCTQLGPQQSPQPPQGLVVLPSISSMLTLLSPKPALLPLPASIQNIPLASNSPAILKETHSKTMQAGDDFVEKMKMILQHGSSQPLLVLPPGTKPSNQDCLELLKKSTQTLRIEYLTKHATAIEEIKRKMTVLQKRQEIQERQINELALDAQNATHTQLRLCANLDDSLFQARTSQSRLQCVLSHLRLSEPESSEAEVKMSAAVRKDDKRAREAKETIDAMTTRISAVKKKIADHAATSNEQTLHLSQQEEENYKSHLAEQMDEINSLRSKLKMLQAELQNARLHSSELATRSISSP